MVASVLLVLDENGGSGNGESVACFRISLLRYIFHTHFLNQQKVIVNFIVFVLFSPERTGYRYLEIKLK